MHTKRLGTMLLEAGLITEEQLGEAIKISGTGKRTTGNDSGQT
ncbi:MAG: hypothetical protein ACLU48_10365 [Clostridiaceae bacterium]